MAEEEEETEAIGRNFPAGRVKRIMKLDKDINKVNSEALFLVSCSTELFLKFLAEKSAEVTIEKKRKTVNLDHMRIAVKRHRPTSYFLLDSLPVPTQPPEVPAVEQNQNRNRNRVATTSKPVPPGTRPINHFFKKSVTEVPDQINNS